jgi:plastocyanin
MRTLHASSTILFAAFTLAACGGKEKPAADGTQQPAAASAPAAAAAGFGDNLTPDAGGKIVKVELETDDDGTNKFEPNVIKARQGDVIRFELKTGAHNIDFVADSNTVKTGLPAASAILQLPGQTTDFKVSLPPGSYYFQCDPHMALGMKAHLEVVAK